MPLRLKVDKYLILEMENISDLLYSDYTVVLYIYGYKDIVKNGMNFKKLKISEKESKK